jgi:chemotaxis protein methyltransferase CheR
MRWPGFRKVRRQVCKRVGRRIQELQLPSESAYRSFLATHPDEWAILDRICQITISRFYRDRHVFGELEESILPSLARSALAEGRATLNCWCIGCASGEEPYTLTLIWAHTLQPQFPGLKLSILATDTNPRLIERAEQAVYPASALKDLPPEWQQRSFAERGDGHVYSLQPAYKQEVEYRCHDIRHGAVGGKYQLVLCRNLVFTYYTEDLQREILQFIGDVMEPAAVLVVGGHEKLPSGSFAALSPGAVFYRKEDAEPLA